MSIMINREKNIFAWTEQMLEKHKNKVDWKAISNNNNIVWTPAMLDKFKKFIDWQELSSTGCETILTEDCLEQFKDYWDWKEISDNRSIELNYPLIDKFIDLWDMPTRFRQANCKIPACGMNL